MSESREISEHQLETTIKDVLTDELAACWSRINDDAAVDDPEEEMSDLMEWFAEQLQATVDDIVEQDPDDEDDYDTSEDEDEEDDEEEGNDEGDGDEDSEE